MNEKEQDKSEMLEWLREYLKTTPKEQIQKEWKEVEDMFPIEENKEQLSIEEAAKKFALEIYGYPNDKKGNFPSDLQQSIMIGFTEGISWRDNNPSGKKMYSKEQTIDLITRAVEEYRDAIIDESDFSLYKYLEQNIINP